MSSKFAKTKVFLMLPVATALVLTGSNKAIADTTTPKTEKVDLSQTEDLFSQPIKSNPLTTDPSTVMIRVNGEEITRGEIDEAMGLAMQQMAGRVPPEQLQQMQAQMYNNLKEQLITKKLMDAAIAAANVEVSDEEVTEAMDKIRASVPQGQTLEAALAAAGTTMEELTENIKEQLKSRKFLESKLVGITDATEAEAKEFYDSNPDKFTKPETVSASHILIKFEDGDTDEIKAEKKAKLEKIRADIISGTNTFEEAAAQFSDCPSKVQGGSLGTFGKGQMVPEFEVAAFSQEKGEVGDIIETQFGYHIIKVSDHQEAGVVDFDEAKDQIISYLTGQKKQEAIAAYIKSLRDAATIEVVTE